MRIAIDAVALLLPSAGVKNYLYHWTRHLIRDSGGADIRLFPLLGTPSHLDHEGSASGQIPTLARLCLFRGLNRLPEVFSRPLLSGFDVFHSAKLVHRPKGPKLTATMHDLTCWTVPETHERRNIEAEMLLADRVWNRADGLIAVSESTRNDAVRLLRIPERKIQVIYPGVPETYSLAGEAEAERAMSQLGLQRPYFLYVGTIEPRKNVDLLLDAYQALPSSIGQEFDLVLTGPAGWARPETLARLKAPTHGVRYLGYVQESYLPGLFAGAAAFVYPSLYEGFGFPVAQAMAAGIPVITSGVSSLAEITDGSALLIDPHSPMELRAAMIDLATSPARRSQLGDLGRVRAARFSWTACARQSMEFFRSVAAESL
jgi:alpha-1,3-rhamnosyl/mannosyltransferase